MTGNAKRHEERVSFHPCVEHTLWWEDEQLQAIESQAWEEQDAEEIESLRLDQVSQTISGQIDPETNRRYAELVEEHDPFYPEDADPDEIRYWQTEFIKLANKRKRM